MSTEIINTERLILRRLRESDLKDFNYYCSKATVAQYMSWAPHKSLEESQEVLQILMKANEWAVVHREDGRMIGTIGLRKSMRETQDSRSLGYAMDDEYWGEGLMTEAVKALLEVNFRESDLALVEVLIRVDNRRSQRLIEGLNFVYEGCLRAYSVDQEGLAKDFNCYSILREEWLRQKHLVAQS